MLLEPVPAGSGLLVETVRPGRGLAASAGAEPVEGRDAIGTVCRAFLVVVLVSAGTSKLAQRDRFFRALAGLPWLPLRAALPASVAIPVVEILLGAALVVAPRAAAVAALGVLTMFTLVVARELLAGGAFHCGCFGGAGVRVAGADTLARNGVLIAAAVAVLLDPPTGSVPASLTGVGLGLLVLLYEVGADTLALARQR